MSHTDGPFMNKAYLGSGAGCAVDAKVSDAGYAQAMQRERVYTFWSVIQQVDNLQAQLRGINFIGHDTALDTLMDDLVKQWAKERRHALRQ